MDPWEVLETPKSAGVDAAKRAWRELVALYHPDHHADMPAGVQKRAAAGLRRVNEAWAAIKATADEPAPAKPATASPSLVEGNGLRLPADEAGDWVFYIEGAPFDAKRRIKQATKAANFSMKAVADNTVVLTKGSFGGKDGVVVDLVDNDGETIATVTDGSPSLVHAMFEALRASI